MNKDTGTGTPMDTDIHLIRLMTWLSPSFPVGAFAFSHGLEHAVDRGDVTDADTVIRWVEGILAFGAGRTDAALFRNAHEAVGENDEARLARAVEWGATLRPTAELALESAAQGRAFLDQMTRAWPDRRLDAWKQALAATDREAAYPIAVGVACALRQIPLRPALTAYLHAFAANLVSAVVRLVPLGQTDGQRALAALEAAVVACTDAALRRRADDYGGAALTVDWHSTQHETQYTRLFRS
ncbi:MAG: urease accessory protein UreF [Rhodobacterales bacterium]|nr:urease accessory protein UreF [Rhodobacterales bacterium]